MRGNLSYDAAIAITTLCVCAYYFGTLYRHWLPEYMLGAEAIASGRFIALPLMLTTAIVMSLLLFTARASFDDKQALVNDMAANALQLDRAMTYYGAPAEQAQTEFRDYMRYLIQNPKAIYELKDRTDAEDFAKHLQGLIVPAKDNGIAANTKKFMLDLMGRLSLDRFKLATKAQRVIYPFSLTLMTVWLVVMFAFTGVTAPMSNGPNFWFSVIAAACVGSISFLIVEYQSSSAGFIQLDASPFEMVLKNIGEK
jgi:hypothetical protein